MKNKWYFVFSNDWNIYNDGFGVELLGLHWESDIRWITIIGFTFLLER